VRTDGASLNAFVTMAVVKRVPLCRQYRISFPFLAACSGIERGENKSKRQIGAVLLGGVFSTLQKGVDCCTLPQVVLHVPNYLVHTTACLAPNNEVVFKSNFGSNVRL
jgi:hypothetical protein